MHHPKGQRTKYIKMEGTRRPPTNYRTENIFKPRKAEAQVQLMLLSIASAASGRCVEDISEGCRM